MIGGAGAETNGPVDLCVVFSQDNRKGTHPPDVCLEASGYRILSRSERTLVIDGLDLYLRELVNAAALDLLAESHLHAALRRLAQAPNPPPVEAV